MKRLQVTGVVAALVAAGVSVAHAQPEERLRQGVLDRDRPAYAARGMRAGNFLIYPAVELKIAHDDNIYAQDGSDTGDFIYETKPEVKVESNLPRHAFYGRAVARNQTYFSKGDENRTDYFLGAGSRIDIRRTTNWNTEAEYQTDTEDRGSPDATGAAAEPVSYSRFQGKSGIRYRPGRLNFEGGGLFERYDFDDVALIGGGTQNNDDRDRNLYGAYSRLGFDVSPGYELFTLGMFSVTKYDDSFDDLQFGTQFNRDSHGFQVESGARIELSNVISSEISVGYLSRDFRDPRLQDINGVSTEAKVEWYVTRLTTVLFSASRRVQETTLRDLVGNPASGYLETIFDAGVDHELLRNVILSAYYRYGIRDYQGISRTDHTQDVTLRAIYMLNRYLSLAGEYRFTARNSDTPGEDYDRNILMLTLRAQI